jgi:hypothetical protein
MVEEKRTRNGSENGEVEQEDNKWKRERKWEVRAG